jgi:hypothetical protein
MRVGIVLGAAAMVLMIPGVAPALGSALGVSSGTIATVGTIAGVASPIPLPLAAAFERAEPPQVGAALDVERLEVEHLAMQSTEHALPVDAGVIQLADFDEPELEPIPKSIEGGST